MTANTTARKIARKVTSKTKNSQFQPGQGVFTCRGCTRRTRAVGNGDADLVDMCEQCYMLAGNENHMNDNGGELWDTPQQVLQAIAIIADKGGKVSQWADVRKAAEKALAPAPSGKFDAVGPDNVALCKVDAASAIAHVERLGGGKVYERAGATVCLTWAYEGAQWHLLNFAGVRVHEQRPS